MCVTCSANSTLNCFQYRFDLPKFRKIISYGCAEGFEVTRLRERYPHALIVGTDIKFGQDTEEARNMTSKALTFHTGEKQKEKNMTLFLPLDEASAYGPFDLLTCNNVLYSHMTVDQFDEFIRSLFSKFLARDAIILITSVIGSPEKILRLTAMKKPEKAKFDPYVVLEWIRTRLVKFRREILAVNKTSVLNVDEQGIMKDSHLFRSPFHELITLDTTGKKEDRDLRGRRLMQFVLRPFGLLRRAQESPLYEHYKRRCVWNFEPRDLLEMDPAKLQQ